MISILGTYKINKVREERRERERVGGWGEKGTRVCGSWILIMYVVIGYWNIYKDYGLTSIQSEQRTKRHAAILGIHRTGSGFADTHMYAIMSLENLPPWDAHA